MSSTARTKRFELLFRERFAGRRGRLDGFHDFRVFGHGVPTEVFPYKHDPTVAIDDRGSGVLKVAFEADVRESLTGNRVLTRETQWRCLLDMTMTMACWGSYR